MTGCFYAAKARGYVMFGKNRVAVSVVNGFFVNGLRARRIKHFNRDSHWQRFIAVSIDEDPLIRMHDDVVDAGSVSQLAKPEPSSAISNR